VPADPAPAVDAALRFVADSPCPLVIVPIEDLLGLEEQPNLPGTTTEHPNWRRRMPDSTAALLARPDVSRRTALLTKATA
jgi:4-alpha-glucanotransferase